MYSFGNDQNDGLEKSYGQDLRKLLKEPEKPSERSLVSNYDKTVERQMVTSYHDSATASQRDMTSKRGSHVAPKPPSMNKLLESNRSLIREMREHAKESSRKLSETSSILDMTHSRMSHLSCKES